MKEKLEIKDRLWISLYILTPVIFSVKKSKCLTDNLIGKVLFTCIFVLLGLGFLQIVKTKTVIVKTIVFLNLLTICITTFVVINKFK